MDAVHIDITTTSSSNTPIQIHGVTNKSRVAGLKCTVPSTEISILRSDIIKNI